MKWIEYYHIRMTQVLPFNEFTLFPPCLAIINVGHPSLLIALDDGVRC